MRNFLTRLGPVDGRRGFSIYQCVCGDLKEFKDSQVKGGVKTSCGCANSNRTTIYEIQNHPLHNRFYAHKFNKLWSFHDFLLELGPQPYEGAWVKPLIAGTQIAPGNVCWGEPQNRLCDFNTDRIEMHNNEFKKNKDLKDLDKAHYELIDDADQSSWKHSLDQIREESKKLREDDTAEWQKNIERQAALVSQEIRKRAEEKAISKGQASQTTIGRMFRYQLVMALAELLEEWHGHALNHKVGLHMAVVDPLLKKGLDYETVAHIVVTVVMDNLGRGTAFQSNLTKIKGEIGRRMDHQAFLNYVEAHRPRDYDKIQRWYLKNGEMGYVHKIGNARKSVPDLNYSFLSSTDSVHVGDWAFTCFERMTKWFEAAKVYNTGKDGFTYYLKLSEEGIKHRRMLDQIAGDADWDSWAMVSPPLDWTPELRGGFLLQHPGVIGKLIHNDKGTIPSEAAFNAINRQQSIAFKVNKFIYHLQEHLIPNYHEIGAFKSYENESWTDANFPLIDPDVWDRPKEDLERRSAKRKLKLAYGEQKKAEKLAKNPYRVLKQAARFVDAPRIYFSCFFDSRLRIYTHAMGLTYQGSDYQKGLLMFADGCKVTDANREQVRNEMLVSIANTWGEDKITYDDRCKFALDLLKDVEFVAKDPVTTASMKIWTAADEPFQWLALVREYYEIFEWKTKDVAEVPGGRDATNSGSQILGSMARDGKTCFYTNVIQEWSDKVSDGPQDLYGVVASKAQVLLRNDVWVNNNLEKYKKQTLKKAEKDGVAIPADRVFMLNLDPSLINRTHLKRLCMIDSYGGSWSSKNDHVSDELSDTAKELGIKISLAEKRLVTDAGIQGQASEFPLSTQLNKWFKGFGKAAIKQGLELIHWTTPDGSYIVQEYREPNVVEITTHAMGGGCYPETRMRGGTKRTRASVMDGYKSDVKEGKTQTALGANFTHSHDSMVIRGVMNTLETSFFGIHDCLYAPHGTLEDACQLLRESFYETVKGDALVDLMRINKVDTALPPKGNADISSCLNSPYMFS